MLKMHFKDFKYLLAYTTPIFAFLGIYLGGAWSPAAVYFSFGIIPLLELISPQHQENIPASEEKNYEANPYFMYLLHFNIFILYGLIFFFLYTLNARTLSSAEIIGMSSGLGIIVGTNINVAHELGHKFAPLDQWIARILLVPALYNHFTIEHNFGHHKHIGTPGDPATSRKNEILYAFWIRSVKGCYLNAWKLTLQQLQREKAGFFSFQNGMVWGHVAQIVYLAAGYYFCGWIGVASLVFAAIVGFLLLESVNYIEHYGLTRKKLPNGKYERVETYHSWNSNHEVGRIFLYELTRHADHHYKSTRPYQILRHWDESPQLPYGYPMSILIAFIPPLWFSIMNRRVENVMTISK
jgi:alkane 1-monooxygenase